VLGTVAAAVISGFATVFFPLEQLLIFRGVDAEQLRRREASLAQILREIATRKKQILVISLNNKPLPGAASALLDGGASKSSSSSSGSGSGSVGVGVAALSTLSSRSRSHDAHDAAAMKAQGLPTAAARAGSATAPAALHSLLAGVVDEDEKFRLTRLAHDVGVLEQLAEELFSEIVELKVRAPLPSPYLGLCLGPYLSLSGLYL